MRLVFVLDCRDPDRLASFWSEAIGYRVSGSSEPYVVLVPANGHGPELVLQHVGEPKTTKNRSTSTSEPMRSTRRSKASRRSALGGFNRT
jgi:hypothetical protein